MGRVTPVPNARRSGDSLTRGGHAVAISLWLVILAFAVAVLVSIPLTYSIAGAGCTIIGLVAAGRIVWLLGLSQWWRR